MPIKSQRAEFLMDLLNSVINEARKRWQPQGPFLSAHLIIRGGLHIMRNFVSN